MFTIIIQEKGGEQRRMVFNKAEVTIGRVQGNDIVLPKGNVSKRHARIVLKDGKFIIVDLKSTNGTYVNGRKITSPLVVKDSDKIYIGDFIVGVDEAASGDSDAQQETSPPPMDNGRSSPGAQGEMRPPRPTEANPMPPGAMGNLGMSGMGGGPQMNAGPMPAEQSPGPPPGQPAPRPGPPRPAPGPQLGGPSREPREPNAGRDMPPLAPPPSEVRTRPPARPGGTMPPPMSGSPGPITMPPPGPSPTQAPMDVPPAPMTSPVQTSAPIVAPQRPEPVPVPAPMVAAQPAQPIAHPSLNSNGANLAPMAAPAAVLAIADKKPKLVGQAMKRVIGRSVAMPSRRGVKLEPLDPKVVKMLDLQSGILERLRAKLDLDKVPLDRLHEEDLWQRASRATIDLVETLETSGELPKYIDQDTLIKETLNEALALGPLEDLLADEKIDEIVIDRRDRVVVGKDGQLRGSGKAFSSDEVFERVVKRLVAEAGAKIDDGTPIVDLRMRDGTRLTAALSPVAARGACLVLKKSPTAMPQLAELVGQNAMSAGMADFLATCVTARRNILVCGAPGSGKTTIAAGLAASSPAGERVVSIEEVAELAIARDEWIQLETRAAVGPSASVDLQNLLETALRLGPDRLVVGDVRGREALPLVSALCSSIDGAIVAMSGEGAGGALARLVTLTRIGASAASDSALRELVAQAFEIVVHVVRWTDGTIRVAAIEEVIGVSDTSFDTQMLFQWKDSAFGPTGTVPRFYAELESRGIPADQAVFR